MTHTTILAAAGDDPQGTLRGIVLYIGMPVIAIMLLFAAKAGKVGALLGLVTVAVLSLTFAFGPASTFRDIGQTGARAISAVLNLNG